MATEKITLKDKQTGNPAYPYTSDEIVKRTGGTNVKNTLNSLEERVASADAQLTTLGTRINAEASARQAADSLKVNKSDVQDISTVADAMVSTTNPISAHSLGVMKQYVDADKASKSYVNDRLNTQDQKINLLDGHEVVVVPDHTAVTNPDPQKIYREPGDDSYTDWMYQGSTWHEMAEYPVPLGTDAVFDENLNKTQEEVNNILYEELNGTGQHTLVQPTSNDFISGYRGSSGKLNEGNYLHILYPVAELRGYTISASNLPSSGVTYTMVSDLRTASSGSTYYDACDGWSNVSEIPTDVTIPNDAEYLYLLCGTTSTATVPTLSSNWEQQGTNGIRQDVEALKDVDAGNRLDALEDIDYDGFVSNDEIFETKAGKNIANPANFSLTLRPKTSTMMIDTSNDVYGSTGLVVVEEGKTYTVSGVSTYVGGYLADGATMTRYQTLLAAIEFTSTIGGKCFTVPTGQNIKYVCVCVKCTDTNKTEFAETSVQIEEGDVASAYEPYSVKTQIKESLLPEGGGSTPTPTPSGEFDELAKYTTFGLLTYPNIADKIPNFRRHWILKDKDLCVVNTGTSLTARGTAHTTARTDAAYRPPLMDLNYLPSILWDKMMWEGQQYRRYDAKTEQGGSTDMFTEVGTFTTTSGLSSWDDYSPSRQGYTRYSDSANASVSFIVPAAAWQFNFIYRTSAEGSEDCVVTINEGDGVMQIWNGTTWVEANGYTFSMKEADVTVLSSITCMNPSTEANTTLNNVQVKGNTTYQKRLKMRAVTRTATKSVTIGCTSGRFMYWGVEWSPREFMITYINAARGSHNSLIANSPSTDRALIHYQDNEIWSFKPDLLLTEDPIHNSGGGNAPSSSRNSCYYANVTENFFFADNGVSMTARATALGLTVPEMVIFNTSLTYNFEAFDTDTGELVIVKQADGVCWSALDAQMSCYAGVITNHPNVVYINAVRNWVEAAIKCYGNLAAATVGSDEDGATFTDEGSHWNDIGCKVMARVVLPVLDFVV